jgi:geranylgeranyl pyrophosphate synthase
VSEQRPEQIAALRAYGMNLGLAFQIADDVLDFTSDEQTLGKPAGSDLRQGTITLPAILLAQRLPASSSLRRDLEQGSMIDAMVRAVQESGVLDVALQRAGEYAGLARNALASFPPSEARDSLEHLTDYVITRRR